MHDDEFAKKQTHMDGYMGQQRALNGYEGFHTGVFLSCFFLFFFFFPSFFTCFPPLPSYYSYYKHNTASICGILNRRGGWVWWTDTSPDSPDGDIQ